MPINIITFWWLNWFRVDSKYWAVTTIDMLRNGIAAAVLGFKINLGNIAMPGIMYINNNKLVTVVKYITKLLIIYSHSIVAGGLSEIS